MHKTISIVIPCYNYAHYLMDCVNSVLEQSYKPDEIIIIDDGSTDNTFEVGDGLVKSQYVSGKEYPRIRYVLQKNKGLSGARNTGISLATSDYIMCLDADDMLKPDAIKEHMKIADENVIAQCGLMYFGSQNAVFRPQGATRETLLHTNTVYCNSVFPKSAWEKVKYDESDTMRLGLEDWLFWIELAIHGYEVRTNDYIALLYRRHPAAMTKQTTHPSWNEIVDYMAKKITSKYGLETHFHKLN